MYTLDKDEKNKIKNILLKPDFDLTWTTVSRLYDIDKEFTISCIPQLINLLKNHPFFNVRRVSSQNLGAIGAKNANLVNDAIIIMIDYIKNPTKVGDSVSFIDNNTETMYEPDSGQDTVKWLRDAYITSIGLIAKGNKDAIKPYKQLFENIAKKEKSEYTKRKAQDILNLL